MVAAADQTWPYHACCRRAGYFWLRFGHGSSDYISQVSSLQAPVHVQMSFMKSLAKGVGTSKYGWVLDVLEQLTICK
jgi:hypothetical protein